MNNAEAMAPDSANTRLIITKMVLENFKSYAGAQEIGPFHKRFSSIVGPNGSGKSNVIDALLFVFGKRANQLRLKKVSELIHKSSSFPNLQYARVSVYFQSIRDNEESEDDYELVPNSDFVVTRVANKDNTSKYTLNDKSISSTALAAMLKGHGIDLDNNRFLILQGEVEQIAMMKPKGATAHEEGLLEYLEDIIGSNRFIEAIDESSKRIDELNEQRVEKVNRLKIAERERDNLSGSKQEAEEFIEKEKQIRSKKNAFYQCLENTANSNVSDFQDRLTKVEDRLKDEQSKVTAAESNLAAMQKDYDQVNGEYNSVSAELSKSTSDYDSFERKDVKLQEDLKYHQGVIKKLSAVVTKERKKEGECIKEAEEVQLAINKCKATISELEASKTEQETLHESIMDSLRESTQHIRQQVEMAQGNLAEQEKAVAGLQTEKEACSMTITLLKSRSDKATKDLEALSEKLQQLRDEKAHTEEKLKTIVSETGPTAEKAVASFETQLVQCDKEEQILQGKVRSAIVAAEEAKAMIAQQQQTGTSGSSHSVQQVLKAAKIGGPLHGVGVRGRLGDLATIAPEYDVAISTACGKLDYIVVETEKAGQACINYLRESNSGRASFILLDQMKDWENKMKQTKSLHTPENTPRLIDLITPSDVALMPAYYMALQNTLVSPTLDTAVRIAYEGDRAMWRVVTKDGNLIDTSGAMSGGGKSVRSGAMKVNGRSNATSASQEKEGGGVTPAMVQQLEQNIFSLKDELTACRNRKMLAEKGLNDSRSVLKAVHEDVDRCHMTINGCIQQEKDLEARILSLRSTLALSMQEKEQIKHADIKLSEIDKRIYEVSPDLKAKQSEVAALQRQILGAGGPKLSKCTSMIESISHSLTMVYGQLTAKEVQEGTCKKQASKCTASLHKAESDIEKSNVKLTSLQAEKDEMEDDAMAVVTAMEQGKTKLAHLEDHLKSSTEEYKKVKSIVSKIKSVEIDLLAELEKTRNELQSSQQDAKKWSKESKMIRKKHEAEQREFNELVKSVVLPTTTTTATTTTATVGSNLNGSVADDMGQEMDQEMNDMEVQDEEMEVGIDLLPVYSTEEILALDVDRLKREINVLEAEKGKMEGKVNVNALLEYLKKDASYRIRLDELEHITDARNIVRQSFEELRRQRLEEFMTGFGVISLKLKEMYQMITLGGDAELELLDSLDPFSEGIVFSVRPPKKSWKNISNLSGGEKTLSSLALVFALHHYKPTPLYVMDEIDAALDFKNVSIVANYIKERTKNAQFVIISLRNNMFELADRLVGIYKTNDATKSVTINPKMFASATMGGPPTKGVSTTSVSTTSPSEVRPSTHGKVAGGSTLVARTNPTTTTTTTTTSNPLGDLTNLSIAVSQAL